MAEFEREEAVVSKLNDFFDLFEQFISVSQSGVIVSLSSFDQLR